MPGEKPGPQNDLLMAIRKGQNIEARMKTFQHGWLKSCQVAQKAGPVAFGEWIGKQTSLINEYGNAVITDAGAAAEGAAGAKAGSGSGG